MLFLRVIAWCGDEKFSLKKSCFYLYIRRYERHYEHHTSGILRILLRRYHEPGWLSGCGTPEDLKRGYGKALVKGTFETD